METNEDLIGFLTHNKRKTGVVFKIKSLRPLEGKKQTGLECPSKGENMQHKISRVNGLLKELGKKENKYKMKENSKNKREDTIYGKPYFQKNVNVEDNENIGITEMQVCVETELLLRYLDKHKKKYNKKKWFFSTVEDAINHIKDKTLK